MTELDPKKLLEVIRDINTLLLLAVSGEAYICVSGSTHYIRWGAVQKDITRLLCQLGSVDLDSLEEDEREALEFFMEPSQFSELDRIGRDSCSFQQNP